MNQTADGIIKDTWQNILSRIGYPKIAITIDFETFFDTGYTLKTIPIVEYLADERFAFTGLGEFTSNRFTRGRSPNFWPPEKIEQRLRQFQEDYGENLEGCTVVGANLPFDAMILAMKFGIYPRFTVDIFDLARYFDPKQLVSVAEQAKRANLTTQKGDTQQFKGLHWEDMTYDQKAAMFSYCRDDVHIETMLFRNLLPTIQNTRKELDLAHHTLELFTKPRFDFDFSLAREIHYDMLKEKNAALAKTGHTAKELSGTISFAQIVRDMLPDDEPLPLKYGKPTKNMIPITGEGMILAVAADDEGRKQLLEHRDPAIRGLMEAKIGQTSWPKWMKRITSMAMQAKAFDGKMPVPLRYCGAHTKRWTGTQKINLMNLGGAGRGGGGTDPLISRIRNLLVAPEGFLLGIVDAAQIECRELAWFAGEDQLLNGFANGEDVYSELAMDLFGTEVHKPIGDESPEEEKRLIIQRGFGKDGVLGCGYGMGADTLYARCMANPSLRPMFESGEYNFEFIKKLVNTYRNKYKMIVKFWSDLEKAFCFVTRFKHEPVELRHGLKFFADGSTTVIELPNGSRLYYPHAHTNGTGRFQTVSYEHGKIYGAMLAENIMQSVSRELLMDVILRCEESLYPVLLHTYDEVVCLIVEDDADRAMKSINEFMCTVPKWAKGLPLGSEGFTTKFFKK